MNLPDLVRRKDRAVMFRTGEAQECIIGDAPQRMRGLKLASGTELLLKDAHGYLYLKDFPSDIHWQLAAGAGVRISAMPHRAGLEVALLCAGVAAGSAPVSLRLDWPLWAGTSGFDILIEAVGPEPVIITVGRLLDPRAKMAPRILGRGLELGPGLTPRIPPTTGLDIEYVEEKTPAEWQAVYGHGKASLDALTPDVMDRYRVGSALTLQEWTEGSLDFIFSNHVVEHLMNPLQVLQNWLGRLKPGGSLLAVVPDVRFTFDLRQEVSTIEEIREEQELGGFMVTEEKYRRWVAFTAPYNTIENLKARNYSIHVHYYTPSLFVKLAALLKSRGSCSGVFIDAVPNNKEFGVVITR